MKKKINYKQFVAWLRGQPAFTYYTYMSNHDCVFARFLKYLGYKNPWVGSSQYDLGGNFNPPNAPLIPAKILAAINVARGGHLYLNNFTRNELLNIIDKKIS